MSTDTQLEREIVNILCSFQSIFFGMERSAILEELSRKIANYEKEDALGIIAIYEPTVKALLRAVEEFSAAESEKEITTTGGSLDTEKLAFIMSARFPRADARYLKRLADQIVYWRYCR